MKIRLFLTLVLILFFINEGKAQIRQIEKKIDSLLTLNLSHKTEDSLKLTRYSQLYRNYIRLDKIEEASNYADKTVALAKKLNKPTFIAEAYYYIGFYHHADNKYFLAEEYYGKSIEKYEELKEKRQIAGVYQNLSAMYAAIPDYSKALDANFKAIENFKGTDDVTGFAACYVNISSVYIGLKQYYNAVQYLEKANKIFRDNNIENNNDYGIALSYVKLGQAFFEVEGLELAKFGITKSQLYEKSLFNLNKAYEIANKDGKQNVGLMGNISEIRASIYAKTGKRDLALSAYKSAISFHKGNSRRDYALSLLALANFYIDGDQEYQSAHNFLQEVIKIGIEDKRDLLQRDAFLALSNMAEKQGKFGDALIYFRKYIYYREQIFNEEKEKEITRKQLQLDFSIKERDYQTKQQVTNLELDRQLLLVKKRQQELLLKQQELELSDKEKNIQRLNFLQTQAGLESEKLQKENQLKQQRLLANLQKEKTDQQLLVQANKAKLTSNLSIFFAVLAVVLLVATLFINSIRRKTAKLNQLVLAQKEELESLGKVKDRIFSVVSHDMRTPVNSLIAFIDLLENGNVSEEKLKRYAANLKNSLGHTSVMMENLLNWAYSQLQGIKPNLENLMISSTLSEAVSAMQNEAAQKQIMLLYLEEGVAQAIADANMLKLIIRNLLSNAIKFTPNGGEIKINVREKEHQAIIEIVDNGTGMSVAQLQSFNTASHQLGETTLGTNKEKGTGLGLTLCKTFAQLMDATLTARSNAPEGTIFMLMLRKTT